jgi:hypothetical protein
MLGLLRRSNGGAGEGSCIGHVGGLFDCMMAALLSSLTAALSAWRQQSR